MELVRCGLILAFSSKALRITVSPVRTYNKGVKSRIWARIGLVSATLVVVLIWVAVLFPIFAKPPPRKNSMVLAGPHQMLRNTDITIRCDGKVRSVRTDGNGRFMLRPEEIGKATIDGYVLTRIATNTGIPRMSTYGTTGQLILSAVDEQGTPFRDVSFSVNSYLDKERKTYHQPDGRLVLNDFPICLDSGYYAQPKGKTSMDLIGLHRHYDGNKVAVEFVYRDQSSSEIKPVIVTR